MCWLGVDRVCIPLMVGAWGLAFMNKQTPRLGSKAVGVILLWLVLLGILHLQLPGIEAFSQADILHEGQLGHGGGLVGAVIAILVKNNDWHSWKLCCFNHGCSYGGPTDHKSFVDPRSTRSKSAGERIGIHRPAGPPWSMILWRTGSGEPEDGSGTWARWISPAESSSMSAPVISALTLAILLGKRCGYAQQPFRPHNLPFTVLGAALLWFGWFGFNAGSALGANELAANAFITTHIAAAAAGPPGLLSNGSTTEHRQFSVRRPAPSRGSWPSPRPAAS